MKFDMQLLYLFLGIGLFSKKLTWRGWFAVCLVIIVWMTFNVLKG
jgi:hypothetical protein